MRRILATLMPLLALLLAGCPDSDQGPAQSNAKPPTQLEQSSLNPTPTVTPKARYPGISD